MKIESLWLLFDGTKKQFLAALLISSFSILFCYGQVSQAWSRKIDPSTWNCITFPNGVLAAIPPNSFDSGSQKRIKISIHEITTKSDSNTSRNEFFLTGSAGRDPISQRRGHPIYLELPLEDWRDLVFASESDSSGLPQKLHAFPYLVDIPLSELYLPTNCEGTQNYGGYDDKLQAPTNQGTLISTREFQNRYWLLVCQEAEFGKYLQSPNSQLHQIDLQLESYFVDAMTYWSETDYAYHRHEALAEQFLSLWEMQLIGIADEQTLDSLARSNFDWRVASGLIRNTLLQRNQKKWIYQRLYVQVLATDDSQYVIYCRKE